MTFARLDLEAIRELWCLEGADSEMGLWWLADDLREALGEGIDEDVIRRKTLEAVRPLLESDRLRAVTLHRDGSFEVWQGDVDQTLDRIATEWKAIGKPNIGDVVWFIGNRPPRGRSQEAIRDRTLAED